MELKNATVNFLGDSITFGVGASCEANRFTDVLKRTYGLKAANNYGISGSRIARQLVVTEEEHDRDFCLRMHEMDASADAVVVFGGTNDFGHGEAPLGVFADRSPATFYGACHYLMSGLLDVYAGKPILILTPLHRAEEENPCGSRKPLSVAPLSVYRDILMETALHYGLPVLDLYATSGIQPRHETCRRLLCPDGLHPSDAGHALIARRIGECLKLL